nr:Protein-arginine deiminase type III (EC 3.5.3.15) [Kibdelosporangium sp. MJ126-NF4]
MSGKVRTVVGVVAASVLVGSGVSASAGSVSALSALSGDTIFLPNVDDDQRRCHVESADLDAVGEEVDVRLAACNDAADERVNGARDEDDLARLRVGRVGGRSGAVSVDAQARVFVKRRGGFDPDLRLSAAELRSGVELGVEGKDILRDPAMWDGWVTVTLTVDNRVRAKHRMRVAPLVLQNDLQPATTVFAARPNEGPGWVDHPAGLPQLPKEFPGDFEKFATPLRQEAADVRFIKGTSTWWKDVWWQDLFEPATASMPTRHGIQTMRVAIRSANIWQVPDAKGNPVLTPRPAGRQLFRDLRGPDVGVVQEYTLDERHFVADLRNATGNIESLPPYDGHPQGRLIYGTAPDSGPTASLKPDKKFITMLTAQGQQPPVVIDTSWLVVGHADETMHVIRANNARGWTLMVADPRLAERLLREVPKDTKLLADTIAPTKPTAGQLLGDTKFLTDNEQAAHHIDSQVQVMLTETGLRPDELIRVPVLFRKAPDLPLYSAFTPGIPNGISLNDRLFAAPDPHGPVTDGKDVFRRETERAIAGSGVRIRWVNDYRWAHIGGGEVHCTTNAWRDTSKALPWWKGQQDL